MANCFGSLCLAAGIVVILFGLGTGVARLGDPDMGEPGHDPAVGVLIAVGGMILIALGAAMAVVGQVRREIEQMRYEARQRPPGAP